MLGLLWLLTGLLILLCAVSSVVALLGFLNPDFDLFNHFQLFWLGGGIIGLVLALLLRMRWFVPGVALLGLAASLWTVGPEYLSSLQPRPPAGSAKVLRLMTHNVFGLNDDMARVAKVIAAQEPDIVALQEYFPAQAYGLDRLLKQTYPYSVRCQGGKRANLGLYSKIPFDREMRDADCPDNAYVTQRTAYIIAGFTLADGSHFSVMTTHMDWPYPTGRQQEEFAAAEAAANAVDGPLLIVGDFNSTPWSYALKGFAAASGTTRETRSLVTYPVLFTVPHGLARTWPFLPLDQVFERGIAVHELHSGPQTGSDHLPVIFDFSVASR